MNRLRPALSAALAFLVLLPSGAQEKKGFVGSIMDRFTAPSRELDPNAVYQPSPRWTFALTGDIHQAGISQKNMFDITSMREDEDGEVYYEEVPSTLTSKLIGNVDKAVGFQAGYGNLSIALSKQLRKDDSDRNFSFDYQSAGHAIQVQFFNLSHPVDYQLTVAEPGHWSYHQMEEETDKPGRLRAFIVDAFYAFNRRTFAYSAAYKGNLFQKRSAGSWMFGSKLILGEFSIDPDETISIITGGVARQTSTQVSFGGGYSYNFVPLHRQPYADRDKGLRNLTINLTFLPMVTLFNQFTSSVFDTDIDGNNYEARKDVMNGKLLVNYVSRIGIGYTHDLFTVNLSASNDSFSYKGATTYALFGSNGSERVKTHGNFSRWMVALRLGKRF